MPTPLGAQTSMIPSGAKNPRNSPSSKVTSHTVNNHKNQCAPTTEAQLIHFWNSVGPANFPWVLVATVTLHACLPKPGRQLSNWPEGAGQVGRVTVSQNVLQLLGVLAIVPGVQEPKALAKA
jgi:hypothetical protein